MTMQAIITCSVVCRHYGFDLHSQVILIRFGMLENGK